MSYKLINANNITFNSDGFITAKNLEKMPCIYADLPNGMDGEHYVLKQEPTEWQKDHEILKAYSDGANEVLDSIRAEIDKARYIDKDTKLCKNANASGLEVAMQIIDKYRESEE